MKDGYVWARRLILISSVTALVGTILLLVRIGDDLHYAVTAFRRPLRLNVESPVAWSIAAHALQPGFMLAKKLVVFWLDGIDRDGALANAWSVPLYYLSWQAVFVVDETIPIQFQEQLRDQGATVIQIPSKYSHWGQLYRFVVLDDPTVDFIMFRDVNSRISSREISSVNTWLHSNKTFHIMRDHPDHRLEIPPNLWSVHASMLRARIGNIIKNITDYVERFREPPRDQKWLKDVVWPLIGDDVVDHDAFHCGNSSVPFPLPRDYHGEFVGLVQDTTAGDSLDKQSVAFWPEYRRHGEATFTPAPQQCRLKPDYIYG